MTCSVRREPEADTRPGLGGVGNRRLDRASGSMRAARARRGPPARGAAMLGATLGQPLLAESREPRIHAGFRAECEGRRPPIPRPGTSKGIRDVDKITRTEEF